MFPLPRIVYAMANDGLLPRCLGSVHSYFKTPLLATLLAGTFKLYISYTWIHSFLLQDSSSSYPISSYLYNTIYPILGSIHSYFKIVRIYLIHFIS